MEILHTELFPSVNIYTGLFVEVSNAAELKSQLKSLKCCFVNTKLLLNIDHLLIAVTRAFHSLGNSASKTGSLFLDIIYYLSGSSNISISLQRFGISENSQSVLVVCTEIEDFTLVQSLIQGKLVNIDGLVGERDIDAICKEFKLKPLEIALPDGCSFSVQGRIAIKDL